MNKIRDIIHQATPVVRDFQKPPRNIVQGTTIWSSDANLVFGFALMEDPKLRMQNLEPCAQNLEPMAQNFETSAHNLKPLAPILEP